MNRISSLPDPIIHHIFSFLETESVIPTSLLSKRWRYLWTSNPYLSFNYYYTPPPDPNLAIDLDDSPYPYTLSDFLDFVDRTLISRDASNILKFNLVCEDKIHKSRVLTWLIATLIRHVQDYDLVLLLDQPFELPYNLFTSNSHVKEFKLSGYFGDVNIRVPISVCFCSKIRVLELDFVKLPDGDCNGEINFSCEGLERLVLSRCEIEHLKVINVSGKRIKWLKMVSSYGDPEFFCKINVFTPELVSLVVSCDTHWDFYLEDFGVLNHADMSVGGDIGKNWMMKFLVGIRNVQCLALSADFFQAIADSPDILEILPGLFHNLRVLTVETGSNNFAYLNRAIANILKILPCLESFALKRYEDTTALNVDEASEDLGKCMPVDCKFDSLKVVKIYNPRMTEDEAKFMLFILERAMYLKEILFIIPHLNVDQINVEPVTIHRATSDVLVHLRRGAAEA